jgi:hypothetical protein
MELSQICVRVCIWKKPYLCFDMLFGSRMPQAKWHQLPCFADFSLFLFRIFGLVLLFVDKGPIVFRRTRTAFGYCGLMVWHRGGKKLVLDIFIYLFACLFWAEHRGGGTSAHMLQVLHGTPLGSIAGKIWDW